MSVIINDNFVKTLREQLLIDLDNNEIIESWFERIITIQFLISKNVFNKITNYTKENIISYCKLENEMFSEIFDENIDILNNNYPIHFFNDKIVKLINENINKDTDVKYIIYMQEEFKNHERLLEFTSTNRNSNTQVNKNNISMVTQIFTPNWVGKYLVQNTIGNSDLYTLKNNDYDYKKITILDPCLGAGQLMIEVFDYLWKKYKQNNIDIKQTIKHIYKNQLFGFDIDKNVITLSKFIFLLKAIELCPDYYKEEVILPNFVTINEFNIKSTNKTIQALQEYFKNASLIGSLIKTPNLDYDKLLNRKNKEEEKLVYISKLLNDKYDVVITNPPYMGRKALPKELLKYLNKNYKYGKSELYTSFIERCLSFLKKDGSLAMLTLHTWMFIKSFKNLRKYIINNYELSSLLHLGKNTFSNLNAYNALASAFIIKNTNNNLKTQFVKLDQYDDILIKEKEFFNKDNYYNINTNEFLKIIDTPFIYWLTDNERKILIHAPKLSKVADIRQGLATGNNKEFLRTWHEIDKSDIGFNCQNIEDFHNSKKLYCPYNKGGDKTKWYGVSKTVIRFDEKTYNILNQQGNHLPSKKYYFKEGITWSLFGFNSFNVRYKEQGYVFDVSGSSLFVKKELQNYILAYLSSNVAFYFLSALAPTVNFQVGNINSLPFIYNETYQYTLNNLVEELISIAKELDSYDELSWNYQIDPFMKHYNKELSILDNINNLNEYMNKLNNKIIINEENINDIFNKIYNMNINKVSNHIYNKKTNKEIIEDLISYLVGLIFKRYEYSDYSNDLDISKFIKVEDVINELDIIFNKYFRYDSKEEIETILNLPIEKYIIDRFGKVHIKKFNDKPLYWYKKVESRKYIGYYHKLNDINKDLTIKENYKINNLEYKLKK